MSDLEMLVRRRMQEEYAKGTSAARISRLVQDIFNSIDASQMNARTRLLAVDGDKPSN